MVRSIVKAFVLMAVLVCIGPHTFAAAAGAVRCLTFRCDVTPPLDGRGLRRMGSAAHQAGGSPVGQRDRARRRARTVRRVCHGLVPAARLDIPAVLPQNRRRRRNRPLPSGHPVSPSAYGAGGRRRRRAARPPGHRRGGHTDLEAIERISDRLSTAVKESLSTCSRWIVWGWARPGSSGLRPHVACWAKMAQSASAGARARTPHCAEPEGRIDPMLKTVTFACGDRPLVRLHYYATHPQTGRNDGWIGMDCVRYARESSSDRRT